MRRPGLAGYVLLTVSCGAFALAAAVGGLSGMWLVAAIFQTMHVVFGVNLLLLLLDLDSMRTAERIGAASNLTRYFVLDNIAMGVFAGMMLCVDRFYFVMPILCVPAFAVDLYAHLSDNGSSRSVEATSMYRTKDSLAKIMTVKVIFQFCLFILTLAYLGSMIVGDAVVHKFADGEFHTEWLNLV